VARTGGPKLKTVTEREQVLACVARLDRMGMSQFEIRDALRDEMGVSVSQPMIGRYLEKIRERYKQKILADRESKVNEMLAGIRDVRAQAWKGWMLSHDDAEKMVEEFGIDREQVSDGDYITSEILVKRINAREGRLPDNSFLATIRATLKDERELLGLDPEAPAPVVNVGVGINMGGADFWAGLAQQVALGIGAVEQRERGVLDGPAAGGSVLEGGVLHAGDGAPSGS
jgi:hypothetical protein